MTTILWGVMLIVVLGCLNAIGEYAMYVTQPKPEAPEDSGSGGSKLEYLLPPEIRALTLDAIDRRMWQIRRDVVPNAESQAELAKLWDRREELKKPSRRPIG